MILKAILHNRTGTTVSWDDTASQAVPVPANTEVVTYCDLSGTTSAVGQLNGTGISFTGAVPGVATGTMASTEANVRTNFYVQFTLLEGEREIVIFEHVGT